MVDRKHTGGGQVITNDGGTSFVGDQSMGGNLLKGLGAAVDANDAMSKAATAALIASGGAGNVAIFAASGSQTGNRFTSWASLIAYLAGAPADVPVTIYIEGNCTVPAGDYTVPSRIYFKASHDPITTLDVLNFDDGAQIKIAGSLNACALGYVGPGVTLQWNVLAGGSNKAPFPIGGTATVSIEIDEADLSNAGGFSDLGLVISTGSGFVHLRIRGAAHIAGGPGGGAAFGSLSAMSYEVDVFDSTTIDALAFQTSSGSAFLTFNVYTAAAAIDPSQGAFGTTVNLQYTGANIFPGMSSGVVLGSPANVGVALDAIVNLYIPVDTHFGGAITNASDTWMFCASGTSVLNGPTNPPRLGTKHFAWVGVLASISIPANSMNNSSTINIVKTTAAGVSTTVGTKTITTGQVTNGGAELTIDLSAVTFAADDAVDVEFVNVGGTGTIRAAVTIHGKAKLKDVQV